MPAKHSKLQGTTRNSELRLAGCMASLHNVTVKIDLLAFSYMSLLSVMRSIYYFTTMANST